jgi:nucleoside-diphosphate-sugar epimerase
LTSSSVTSNEKFKKEFGWKPEYPNFQSGLKDVLETWKQEGILDKIKKGI